VFTGKCAFGEMVREKMVRGEIKYGNWLAGNGPLGRLLPSFRGLFSISVSIGIQKLIQFIN
jgi:hypothetical protein